MNAFLLRCLSIAALITAISYHPLHAGLTDCIRDCVSDNMDCVENCDGLPAFSERQFRCYGGCDQTHGLCKDDCFATSWFDERVNELWQLCGGGGPTV